MREVEEKHKAFQERKHERKQIDETISAAILSTK